MENKEEKIVMYESDEAATFVTNISGWVSSNGHFYGKDERAARYDGSTHHKCECGEIAERMYTCCKRCREKNDHARYMALPEVPFEEVECCMLWEDDKFFFDPGDVAEYLENNDLQPEDIQLQVCEAKDKLSHVHEEQWQDELPEEGELPEEIRTALKALNEAIDNHSPTIWWGIKKRTTYKNLYEERETEDSDLP